MRISDWSSDVCSSDLAFAIDFHSTWSDVFYTVEEAPSRRPGGVLRRWIDDMQQRYPGRIRESASPSGNSAVFKNWAFRQYHAPTVTYEVGDKTGSEQLHELATFAADRAMRSEESRVGKECVSTCRSRG